MKFKVEVEKIRTALRPVLPVAKTRITTIPELSCVKLKLNKHSLLELASTDMDVFVRAEIPVEGAKEGEALVPARTLQNILVVAGESTIDIELQRGRVKFSTDDASWSVLAQNLENFPEWPKMPDKVVAEGRSLIGNVLRVAPIAKTAAPERSVLHHIFLDQCGSVLRVVASDGRRLALSIAQPANTDFKALLPEHVPDLLNLLPEGEDTWWCSDAYIEFSVCLEDDGFSFEVLARLGEYQVPEYSKVIPAKSDNFITCNRLALLAALKKITVLNGAGAVSLQADAQSKALRLDLRGEIGIASAICGVEQIEGVLPKVSFNPFYLRQQLELWADFETVTIHFGESERDAILLVAGDDGDLAVIMPILRAMS